MVVEDSLELSQPLYHSFDISEQTVNVLLLGGVQLVLTVLQPREGQE